MSMAEEQSDQTGDLTESKSEEDSKNISSSLASSDKLDHSKGQSQVDEIPTEILEALPPEMRQAVSASFTAMVHSATLHPSIYRQSLSTVIMTAEEILT